MGVDPGKLCDAAGFGQRSDRVYAPQDEFTTEHLEQLVNEIKIGVS